MAYMDIGPASPANFSCELYALTEPEGYFYGRGTLAQTTPNLFVDLPALKRAKYALHPDGGTCALDTAGKAEYCPVNTAEKTYITFFARFKNPGGDSSLPRKDHAMYELVSMSSAPTLSHTTSGTNAPATEIIWNTSPGLPRRKILKSGEKRSQ
jgi:hypothetical protein